MPYGKWTDDDIAKLKNLAGKVPARDIAAERGGPRMFGGAGFKAADSARMQSL